MGNGDPAPIAGAKTTSAAFICCGCGCEGPVLGALSSTGSIQLLLLLRAQFPLLETLFPDTTPEQ